MRGLFSWLDHRREIRRAGSSARAEYERLKRDWRSRTRTRFIVLGTIFAAVIVAFWIAAAVWSALEFTSGLVSGALLAVFVALRESPPGWVDQWLMGSQGELWTDEQLRKLEKRGWVVLRDLKRQGYNVDHVVIGPGGVFVIDSKNLDGRVTCAGDELRIHRPGANPMARPAYCTPQPARGVRSQAAELNNRLRTRAGRSIWVTGVVAVWADLEPEVVAGDRMHFVRGDSLTTWLQAQPARLNPDQVTTIGLGLTPARRRKVG
jgi:hypothetical protein